MVSGRPARFAPPIRGGSVSVRCPRPHRVSVMEPDGFLREVRRRDSTLPVPAKENSSAGRAKQVRNRTRRNLESGCRGVRKAAAELDVGPTARWAGCSPTIPPMPPCFLAAPGPAPRQGCGKARPRTGRHSGDHTAEPRQAYQQALLYLRAGDAAGYRATCVLLLERWGRTADPEVARLVVQACVLAPDSIADLRPLLAVVTPPSAPSTASTAQQPGTCTASGSRGCASSPPAPRAAGCPAGL